MTMILILLTDIEEDDDELADNEVAANGLALLQYHRNISVTADGVVQEFVRCHPRRLLMVNPFK